MISGYARETGDERSLEAQLDALARAGVESVRIEGLAHGGRARPELDRLLDQLRPGDVVVTTCYERLSRSLVELLGIVEAIHAKGAGLRALDEGVDTTLPEARHASRVFDSIARFERGRISARTREGLAAARKLGRIGGRPPALDPRQKAEVRRLRDEEGRRIAEIARLFKVSVNTVRRA